MSVSIASGSNDFGDDGRSTSDSQVHALEHEHGGTFAHDETIACRIEWLAHQCAGQGSHIAETS